MKATLGYKMQLVTTMLEISGYVEDFPLISTGKNAAEYSQLPWLAWNKAKEQSVVV